MNFFDKLTNKIPTISYEFFPPKTSAGWHTLYSTLGEVKQKNLDFISVTYGAGGTTRDKTLSLVERIQGELEIDTMAHLTCVGHSKSEIHSILEKLSDAGVKAIMALRGDPPQGQSKFTPHPEGFAYASELIAYIKKHFDFKIGCAYYPEKHSEAISLDVDIEHLKIKQDNGADFAASQLFFNNEKFYSFRDKAIKAGVNLPLTAGIMPVSSIGQMSKFQEMCACQIPGVLKGMMEGCSKQEAVEVGIAYATGQCVDLLKNGIAGIHLYSLNRSQAAALIVENLRLKGFLAVE